MKILKDKIHLIKENTNVVEKKTKAVRKLLKIYSQQKIVVIEDDGINVHLTWESFRRKYYLPHEEFKK